MVEDFPTELQALAFAPRHFPSLTEPHVDAKVARTTEDVALLKKNSHVKIK
jgi:hypothetical protein